MKHVVTTGMIEGNAENENRERRHWMDKLAN